MTGLHNALVRAADHGGCEVQPKLSPPRADAPHELSAWAVEDLALDRILKDFFKLPSNLNQEVLRSSHCACSKLLCGNTVLIMALQF